jgi:hypothetical protein
VQDRNIADLQEQKKQIDFRKQLEQYAQPSSAYHIPTSTQDNTDYTVTHARVSYQYSPVNQSRVDPEDLNGRVADVMPDGRVDPTATGFTRALPSDTSSYFIPIKSERTDMLVDRFLEHYDKQRTQTDGLDNVNITAPHMLTADGEFPHSFLTNL